jgi:hypothetical protein
MANFPRAEAFEPDRWLEQGDTVSVGEQTLRVFHCPGHTPGHVVFLHDGERIAWVGDVLFQGSIGRTDFPARRPRAADRQHPRDPVSPRRRHHVHSRTRPDIDLRPASVRPIPSSLTVATAE